MTRPRLIQLLALLLCGALVFGTSRLIPSINDGRQKLNMYGSADVVENAPPEYAFWIQAFGAFRSLIVDVAFIRAEAAKEDGRFFDAMQLRQWICDLQPRFPAVWEYQAWDLAWNISVTTYTAVERWNWVYAGVKLLRDKGIPLNPRAVNLYKQLAWIFNNKMGETIDDFHWDYKRNWAWRMHLLLGPVQSFTRAFDPEATDIDVPLFGLTDDPLMEAARVTAEQAEERRKRRGSELNVPYRTTKSLDERLNEIPEETPEDESPQRAYRTRAVLAFVRDIEAAAKTLPELYEAYPATRDMVAQLRQIGVDISDDTLDEDSYWYEGKLAQTFFERWRKLVDSPSLLEQIEIGDTNRTPADPQLARFDELVGATAHKPEGEALLRFLQRKVLIEVYKLKPEHMAQVVETFGPVDWRAVDSQSLYWVSEGLVQGGETVSSFQNDKTNTARILFFSLRNLELRNRITFEPNPDDIVRSYINFAPDIDFVEALHQAYITYGPLIDPDPGDRGGVGNIFRSGHINLLTEGIRMLWFADRKAEAEKYYAYLRENYSTRLDGSFEDRYTQPLDDFVITSYYGLLDTPREVEQVVQNLLFQGYNHLAAGDITAYNSSVSEAAKRLAAYSQQKHIQDAAASKHLRAFPEYQKDVFRQWFTLVAVNPEILIHKARLWRRAPVPLKQWVYDSLIEPLSKECEYWGFDPAKAFPEPPNMAEFRKLHPRREVDVKEQELETLHDQ